MLVVLLVVVMLLCDVMSFHSVVKSEKTKEINLKRIINFFYIFTAMFGLEFYIARMGIER